MAQLFEQSKKVIEAQLAGTSIRAIAGSMVAYEGNVQFKSAGFGGGEGVLNGLKRRATGEKLSLMECNGNGRVFLAVNGQNVTVVNLDNETLQVESQQLLAFAGNLRTDVRFAGVGGMSAGSGLFTTTVSGQGQVALLSAGGPLIHLEVSPQYPLIVDPDAFVASRGNLNQSFVTDVSWRSMVGQDAGEAFSLRFDGQGVVLIQPHGTVGAGDVREGQQQGRQGQRRAGGRRRRPLRRDAVLHGSGGVRAASDSRRRSGHGRWWFDADGRADDGR